ncbi:MAG TPA: hypothetical protein VM487_07640 [Phycisphaerae bacterium]|nr:hypothetical protein [Phycisphaerae bacterium]
MLLFSLLHYPCTTITWTIYRETGSLKWALWSNVMPLSIAITVCIAVAQLTRLVGGQPVGGRPWTAQTDAFRRQVPNIAYTVLALPDRRSDNSL